MVIWLWVFLLMIDINDKWGIFEGWWELWDLLIDSFDFIVLLLNGGLDDFLLLMEFWFKFIFCKFLEFLILGVFLNLRDMEEFFCLEILSLLLLSICWLFFWVSFGLFFSFIVNWGVEVFLFLNYLVWIFGNML